MFVEKRVYNGKFKKKTRYCKKGSIIAWVNIIQTRSMISFPRDFDERILTLENIISEKIMLRNSTSLI